MVTVAGRTSGMAGHSPGAGQGLGWLGSMSGAGYWWQGHKGAGVCVQAGRCSGGMVRWLAGVQEAVLSKGLSTAVTVGWAAPACSNGKGMGLGTVVAGEGTMWLYTNVGKVAQVLGSYSKVGRVVVGWEG